MIDWSWMTATGTSVFMAVLSGLGIYLALLLFTRLSGLRSFSKMSSFDFAITVAFGSVIASTILAEDPPLLVGVAGLAVLYLMQYGVSVARRRTSLAERIVDNEPLLVMFESTGDVAVLKSGEEPAPWMFEGVRGASRLPFMPGPS